MNVKRTTRIAVELTCDETIEAIICWLTKCVGNNRSCNLAARILNGDKRKLLLRNKKLIVEFQEEDNEET